MTQAGDEVIARFTRTNPVFLFFGIALAFFIIWWVVTGHQERYAVAILLIGCVCLGYFLWRLVVISNALLRHNGRAIYVADGVIHGLSMQSVQAADIRSVDLRINEAGRAVLSLTLGSGEVVRTPISGMEPSPQEIEAKFVAMTLKTR